MNYLFRVVRSKALLQSGPKMLTGLALAITGLLLSYPVLVGQHGDGISWWPAMIFVGLSWFLIGCARMVAVRLG